MLMPIRLGNVLLNCSKFHFYNLQFYCCYATANATKIAKKQVSTVNVIKKNLTEAIQNEISEIPAKLPSETSKSLKFLSWNVDGLDPVSLNERTKEIVKIINK